MHPPSSPGPRLGGMVGSAVYDDEPVAVHSSGTKGYRIRRAPSIPQPPSSPGPHPFSLPEHGVSQAEYCSSPSTEREFLWKETAKVVLEEGGKGPRGGWWVQVSNSTSVLRCWVGLYT